MINSQHIIKSDILLVELKLNASLPKLFTLMIMGEEKDYILNDGINLLFYNDINRTNEILEAFFTGISFSETDAHELVQKCYPAEIIRIIQNVDSVNSSLVLDSTNSLLDFTNTLPHQIPENLKTILREFAGHATFEVEYESFFLDKSHSKADLVDAIYWCIGYLMIHVRVI
jgi:hypothetical protein